VVAFGHRPVIRAAIVSTVATMTTKDDTPRPMYQSRSPPLNSSTPPF
jgi:hypothetical protein